MTKESDIALRVLAGVVARQMNPERGDALVSSFSILPVFRKMDPDVRKDILSKVRKMFSDRRIPLVQDQRRLTAFVEILKINPKLALDPTFAMNYELFLGTELNRFIQIHGNDLFAHALLEKVDNPYANSYVSFQSLIEYIGSSPGRMLEIIGLMGAGKSNSMTHLGLVLMERGHHIISNVPFHLSGTDKEQLKDTLHQVTRLSDGLRQTAKLLIAGEKKTIVWIVDETGAIKGATTKTSMTQASKWFGMLFTKFRKFKVFYIEARQIPNLPEEIKEYVTIEVNKDIGDIKNFQYRFLQGAEEGLTGQFEVPDRSNYYDTTAPSPLQFDVDMYRYEKHEREAAERGLSPYEILQYALARSIMRPGQGEEGFEENVVTAGVKEEFKAGNKEPLYLHHLNCPQLNGLIYSWKPKKYVPEGTRVTCPKCGGHFYVHYTASESATRISAEMPQLPPLNEVSSSQREGYRGIDHEENSGPVPRGDTASLNTQGEDLPGLDQGEMMVNPIEAAEELAADAINLFMDVVTDPEKMKALEDDPELKEQFKQLMNTEIPAVDIDNVTERASRKRKWSKQVPELQEESLRLRQMASDKRECANCGKQLTGNQVYYCSDDCKAEFYANHPTSVRWNDLRAKALERDHNLCVKCGRPAEEVDHIKEIWEGGPEFDLNNLQSLCHECHVLKTNENRRKREA